MIKRFLLLLCLAMPLSAGAETIDPRLARSDVCGRYELFHINGVNKDAAGAASNLDALRTTYGNAHDGHIIAYGLAYNPTRGAPRDFMDAFAQVIQGYPGATFGDWLRAVVFGMYNSIMTAEVAAAIAQGVAAVFDFNRPPLYSDLDLGNIETAIRTGHSQTARVLLVPHSQGNIYANLVRDRLTAVGGPRTPIPAQSIGIMGVATPRAVQGGLYLTSENDLVINGIRFVFTDTPAANINIPVDTIDRAGHNFRDIYLALAPTPVNNLISLAFSRLASPPGVADPPFSAYMHALVTWDNCGPGSGNPYNCWFEGQIRLEPYYIFQAPGSGTWVAVVGSWTEAVTAAANNAATCQSLGAAELARQQAASPGNSFPYFQINGCFPYGPGPNLTMAATYGDSTRSQVRQTYFPDSWRGFAAGHITGACRRAA